MFNNTIKAHLTDMGFDPHQFYQKIFQLYASNEYLFESLIEKFYPQKKFDNQDFNSFAHQNNLEDNSALFNTLYELFNNIGNLKTEVN